MEKINYDEHYSGLFRSSSADRLKFWLMPFAIFVLFGFPTFGSSGVVSGYIQNLSKFVIPTFFVLSGFFILTPDDTERGKKIINAVKRTFFTFLIMFAVYTVINLIYYSYKHAGWAWTANLLSGSNVFKFLALNIYPFSMGASLSFIHRYFYACIVLLILDKCKLLKQPVIYVPLLVILFTVMLSCGEFAKVLGITYFSYLPGLAITMTLPYMLLGMVIRKHANSILNIPRYVFAILFVLGFAMSIAELVALNKFELFVYGGHTVGFMLMAVSLCCFALANTNRSQSFVAIHGRSYSKRIYYLCPVVNMIALNLIQTAVPKRYRGSIGDFLSVFIYLICLFLAYAIGKLKFTFFMNMTTNDRKYRDPHIL